jgi:hypothetical protein
VLAHPVTTNGVIGMHADDVDAINGLPVAAGQNGSTTLSRLAGSDEWSAMFPVAMAPKTLPQKVLCCGIMRKIRGLNRSMGRLDGHPMEGRKAG